MIWVEELLINNWFNVSVDQIYIFIFFVNASVLFKGMFSLWVSWNYYNKKVEKLSSIWSKMHCENKSGNLESVKK